MVVKRKRKATRQRGSRTYGWGVVHRNSGSKGGAGKAGSGKKADSKKPSNWKDPLYFGRHGFVPKGPVHKEFIINVREIDENVELWVKEGKAKDEKGTYSLDLSALGYTKLLSTGSITHKIIISVEAASEGAIEKVKAAGGEVKIIK